MHVLRPVGEVALPAPPRTPAIGKAIRVWWLWMREERWMRGWVHGMELVGELIPELRLAHSPGLHWLMWVWGMLPRTIVGVVTMIAHRAYPIT